MNKAAKALCQICHLNTPEEGRQVCDQCMSLRPSAPYVCDLHGPHDGVKVGRNHTSSCPACVKKKQSENIRRAKARGASSLAKPSLLPYGTDDHPGQPPPETTVTIDFSACQWLLGWLKTQAQDKEPSAFIKEALLALLPDDELRSLLGKGL